MLNGSITQGKRLAAMIFVICKDYAAEYKSWTQVLHGFCTSFQTGSMAGNGEALQTGGSAKRATTKSFNLWSITHIC